MILYSYYKYENDQYFECKCGYIYDWGSRYFLEKSGTKEIPNM